VGVIFNRGRDREGYRLVSSLFLTQVGVYVYEFVCVCTHTHTVDMG